MIFFFMSVNVPSHLQQYSKPVNVCVSLLWGQKFGPTRTGEALYGEPPERSQQGGKLTLFKLLDY